MNRKDIRIRAGVKDNNQFVLLWANHVYKYNDTKRGFVVDVIVHPMASSKSFQNER